MTAEQKQIREVLRLIILLHSSLDALDVVATNKAVYRQELKNSGKRFERELEKVLNRFLTRMYDNDQDMYEQIQDAVSTCSDMLVNDSLAYLTGLKSTEEELKTKDE